ncbi:MAG TPA: serine protease [Xanthobacteraceae bacterium]|nr:serine protease [Xanthobacteraceae bacterium]
MRHSLLNLVRTAGRAGLLAMMVSGTAWSAEPPAAAPPAAERIFADATARLLQIRTLLVGAGRQSSTGSGFLVSANGLAITNYHVVSQVALEPKSYRLEYLAVDGSRGDVELLAIDLPNDLAVVRLDKRDAPFFAFNDSARDLPKGERLYSLGNPLDLGFTITEGTYNGQVERSYNERIHFTGALNPGMSGGPAVTADGLVVGVNVAKRSGGELVSFLVPGRFAAALLRRVEEEKIEPQQDFRAEIGRQLGAWQASLYRSLEEQGFRSVTFGPYQAAEATAPWFTCWAQTNAGAIPKPRASVDTTNCRSDTGLFIAADLSTGGILLSHAYARTVDLNEFQFATFLSQQAQARPIGGGAYRKWFTPQRCHEDFVTTSAANDRPTLRVIWCAQAYREFAGPYDVAVIAVTEDKGSEALVSRLALQAVGYDDAVAFSKRFLQAVQWTR